MRESMSLGNTKGASAYLGAVLIIGLGRSGKACTNYCLSLLNHRISSLTIYAGPADPETVEWARHAEEAGATIIFDEEDITGFYDLCIASPGISEYSAFYRQSAAASDEIISEVEFAWRESAADSVWVAVTGTNGKTTTTSLIAHILDQAGRRACAVGNIGDTCIDAVASGDFDIYVAETSSFQLASTTKFAPNVAIVLNITQDHLKWHKSYEGYIEAKWKILDNLPEVNGSCAILNAINDEVRKKIKEIRDDEGRGYSYIPIGAASGIEADMRKLCGSVNAAFEDDLGWLCVGLGPATERICPRNEFEPMGEHNVINALAASSACLVLGLTPHEIAEGLQTFGPLEHRLEPCGDIGGVRCINDSKATNVDATLTALDAFDTEAPIILLGGRDKGGELAELVKKCEEKASAVVCFGEAADRFADAFEGSSIPVMKVATMEEAIDAALSVSEPGEVILLSPACASFDEFTCFEDRGEKFKEMVKARSDAAKTEADLYVVDPSNDPRDPEVSAY